MKKIIFVLLISALAGNVISSFSITLDSNVFKYFPLKVGNRWTWQGFAYPIMPPLNISQKIISTRIINNHLYYFPGLITFIIMARYKIQLIVTAELIR